MISVGLGFKTETYRMKIIKSHGISVFRQTDHVIEARRTDLVVVDKKEEVVK